MKITVSGTTCSGKTTMARYICYLLSQRGFNMINEDVDFETDIVNVGEEIQNKRVQLLVDKKDPIVVDTKYFPRSGSIK